MAERTDLSTRARTEGMTAERSAEEIRQDIAAKRETITETVDRLGERIHQTLDWREYIADYPYVALGAAAGLGFLLSGIFKPRPTPRERILEAVAETFEDFTDRLRDTVHDAMGDLPLKKKSGPGKTVKAAITAMLTKAAVDYVKGQAGERLFGRGATHNGRQTASRGFERTGFDQHI